MVVLYLDEKVRYRAELNKKLFDLKLPSISDVKLVPLYYSNKNYFHDLYSNIIFACTDGLLLPKGIIDVSDDLILPHWFNNVKVVDKDDNVTPMIYSP